MIICLFALKFVIGVYFYVCFYLHVLLKETSCCFEMSKRSRKKLYLLCRVTDCHLFTFHENAFLQATLNLTFLIKNFPLCFMNATVSEQCSCKNKTSSYFNANKTSIIFAVQNL